MAKIKRGILTFFVLTLFLGFICAVDCPLGLENDSYPGNCRLYTDYNGDKICDLSQEPINNSGNANSITLFGKYNFLVIVVVSSLIYLLSYILVKKNVIQIITHKKIWNGLLAVSFLITAITSLVYLLKFDLGLNIDNIDKISFLHIELGLIMIIIAIFHALWHLSYFKNCYFKFSNKDCKK